MSQRHIQVRDRETKGVPEASRQARRPHVRLGWANARTVDEAFSKPAVPPRFATRSDSRSGSSTARRPGPASRRGDQGPLRRADAYVSTFYEECRPAISSTTASPGTVTRRSTAARSSMTRRSSDAFYGWSPMLYGTNQALVQRNWNTRPSATQGCALCDAGMWPNRQGRQCLGHLAVRPQNGRLRNEGPAPQHSARLGLLVSSGTGPRTNS